MMQVFKVLTRRHDDQVFREKQVFSEQKEERKLFHIVQITLHYRQQPTRETSH